MNTHTKACCEKCLTMKWNPIDGVNTTCINPSCTCHQPIAASEPPLWNPIDQEWTTKDTPQSSPSWEEEKKNYILRYMASFQKYFGKNATECPDCGAPAWYVCEKNIREMLGVVIDAGDRRAQKLISTVEREAYTKGQAEARAHYYERVREEAIRSTIEKAIESLPRAEIIRDDQYKATNEGSNRFRNAAIEALRSMLNNKGV